MGLELGPLANINFRTPPKPVRIVVIVLPVILVAALTVFVVLDKKKVLDQLKNDIASLDKKITAAQAIANKLPEVEAAYRLMEQELCELEKVVPAEYEVSSFLKQLNAHAIERQISILQWKESPPRQYPKGIVNELPVNLTLSGAYHKLGEFLADITTFDRVINVNNISFTSAKKEKGVVKLNAAITASAFTTIKPVECSKYQGGGAK